MQNTRIFSSCASKFLSLSVLFVLVVFALSLMGENTSVPWGFYPHKLINKYAVFTLPYDMLPFYKTNASYLYEHAVDPDRRRYSSSHEAIRHYIDLDYWDDAGRNLPAAWDSFAMKFYYLKLIHGRDTMIYSRDSLKSEVDVSNNVLTYLDSLSAALLMQLPEEQVLEDFPVFFSGFSQYDCYQGIHGAKHGVVPFIIAYQYRRLRNAFEHHRYAAIIRISADLGHYIADAHVPLHTTSNYDGQKTGQEGIHAFWETRIPELMAEREFDLFAGKAKYIDDVEQWASNVVRSSHRLVDRVLHVEDSLRNAIPADKQYQFIERSGQIVRKESSEFASQYESSMHDMVEDRMRAAIRGIGSLWMTAWVDAGQPELPKDWRFRYLRRANLQDSIKNEVETSGCHLK